MNWGEQFQRQYGPLPLWGWMVVGGILVGFWVYLRRNASTGINTLTGQKIDASEGIAAQIKEQQYQTSLLSSQLKDIQAAIEKLSPKSYQPNPPLPAPTFIYPVEPSKSQPILYHSENGKTVAGIPPASQYWAH